MPIHISGSHRYSGRAAATAVRRYASTSASTAAKSPKLQVCNDSQPPSQQHGHPVPDGLGQFVHPGRAGQPFGHEVRPGDGIAIGGQRGRLDPAVTAALRHRDGLLANSTRAAIGAISASASDSRLRTAARSALSPAGSAASACRSRSTCRWSPVRTSNPAAPPPRPSAARANSSPRPAARANDAASRVRRPGPHDVAGQPLRLTELAQHLEPGPHPGPANDRWRYPDGLLISPVRPPLCVRRATTSAPHGLARTPPSRGTSDIPSRCASETPSVSAARAPSNSSATRACSRDHSTIDWPLSTTFRDEAWAKAKPVAGSLSTSRAATASWLEQLDHRVLRDTGNRRDQHLVYRISSHRGSAEQAVAGLCQPGQSPLQHLAHTGRHRERARRCPARPTAAQPRERRTGCHQSGQTADRPHLQGGFTSSGPGGQAARCRPVQPGQGHPADAGRQVEQMRAYLRRGLPGLVATRHDQRCWHARQRVDDASQEQQ